MICIHMYGRKPTHTLNLLSTTIPEKKPHIFFFLCSPIWLCQTHPAQSGMRAAKVSCIPRAR